MDKMWIPCFFLLLICTVVFGETKVNTNEVLIKTDNVNEIVQEMNMNCVVKNHFPLIKRCENDEVVCYVTIDGISTTVDNIANGISCQFKEVK